MLVTKYGVLATIFPALVLIAFVSADFIRESWIVYPLMNSNRLIGTPERLEREYKLGIEKNESREILISSLNTAVQMCVKANPFSAEKPITAELSEGSSFYRDIYFDSKELALFFSKVTYRMRHRYPSKASYLQYQKGSRRKDVLPTRFEIQSKKKLEGDDKSQLAVFDEARLEFPLGQKDLPTNISLPTSPWPVEQFLKVAQSGFFLGLRTTPAHIIDKYIKERKFLKIEPKLAIFTQRYRWHLSRESKLGTGNNPDHVLLVSLDIPEVLVLNGSLDPLILDISSAAKSIEAEIEIELDRNISVPLENQNDSGLLETYSAYHQLIQNCINKELKILNIGTYPQMINKYSRALRVNGEI